MKSWATWGRQPAGQERGGAGSSGGRRVHTPRISHRGHRSSGGRTEQPASILTMGYSRSQIHQHVPGDPGHPQIWQGAPQLLPEQGRAEDRVAGCCHSPRSLLLARIVL